MTRSLLPPTMKKDEEEEEERSFLTQRRTLFAPTEEPKGIEDNELVKTEEGGLITKIFDNISRGNFAVANMALDMATGETESMSDVGTSLREGFSMKDKTSWTDVMDEVAPGWHPWARGTAGFVGDVVLDPINLVPMAWPAKAGKLLKLGEKVKKLDDLTGMSRMVEKIDKAFHKIPGVKQLGRAFVPGYELRDVKGGYAAWRDLQLELNDIRREVQKEFRESWDDFRKISKKMGEDPDKAAAHLVKQHEMGMPQNIANEFMPFYDKVTKGLAGLAEEEVKHGILSEQSIKKWYFPHIYEKGKVVEKAGELVVKKQKGFYTNLKFRHAPFFSKAREFASIEDAKSWLVKQRKGEKVKEIAPVENWFRGYAIRRFTGESAVAWKKFVNETFQNPEFARPLTDFFEFEKINIMDPESLTKFSAKLPKEHSFVTPTTNLRAPMMKGMFGKTLKEDITKPPENIWSKMRETIGKEDLKDADVLTEKIFKAVEGRGLIELDIEDVGKLVEHSADQVYLMPTAFAKTIKDTFKVFGSDESTKGFLKAMQKGVHMWKSMATSMRWSFHMRNAISNQWLMYLGGVAAIKMPQRIAEAGLVQLKKKGVNGYSAEEMLNMADRYGVRAYGWMGADVPKMFQKELFVIEQRKPLARMLGVGDQAWNPFQTWSRAGRKVGTGIEDNSRLALFIDQIKKRGIKKGMPQEELTKGIQDSSDHVKKYLFDYTELTDFERSTMKFVFPFYTWMRKNIPLQLKSLVEHPEKWARLADFERNLFPDAEKDPMEALAMKESWMGSERYYKTPWSTEDDRPIYYQIDLPIEDVEKATSMRHWISGLSPYYALFQTTQNLRTWPVAEKLAEPGMKERAPWYVPLFPEKMQKWMGVELIRNQQKKKIEVGMDPQWKYALKTAFPFLNDWDKVFPHPPSVVAEDEDKKLQLLSYASGIKFRGFGKEEALRSRHYRQQKAKRILQRVVRQRAEGLTVEEAKKIFGEITEP